MQCAIRESRLTGMLLPHFDFEAPETLDRACALLAEGGREARLLAGGTDLLVKMKRGELVPRLLLSLGRIPGLEGIEETGGVLSVGPMTRMARIAASPLLTGPWGALAEGAGSVGGPIIRNRATVGGNIVNARPCADTVPPLVVLGAQLRLESASGSRLAELDGFLTGPGLTRIAEGEVLAGIVVPVPPTPRAGSAYVKITRRAAMEVTIIGCAASIVLDEEGSRVLDARIVLSSVAAVPLRVPEAEGVLRGQVPSDEAMRAAGAEVRRAVRPIDDQRAPASYRREISEVIARRALGTALARAMGRRS